MDLFEKLATVCMATPLALGPNAPNELDNKWGINLNVIGSSGGGKSARIYAIGKAMGLNVYPIFSATKAPEHIGGFPVMTPRGFTLECALQQVRSAIDDGNAILFLDEISSAPPAVQAALLSFVNERTIGEYRLPPGVRIILAMNPSDIAANGRDLEIPLANRVLHYNYKSLSLNSWKNLMRGTYDPGIQAISGCMDTVRSTWRDHFGSVLELTVAFLESNGGLIERKDENEEVVKRSKFEDQPSSDDPRASGPWPSQRTWHWAINGITTARCLGMDMDVQSNIVAGLVGKGIAEEWGSYVKKFNLPHPLDVLTNGWSIPKQLDVVRVVLSSCAAYVVQETDQQKRVMLGLNCLNLIATAGNSGYLDICMPPFKQMLTGGFDLMHPDPRIQEAAQKIALSLNEKGYVKYI